MWSNNNIKPSRERGKKETIETYVLNRKEELEENAKALSNT